MTDNPVAAGASFLGLISFKDLASQVSYEGGTDLRPDPALPQPGQVRVGPPAVVPWRHMPQVGAEVKVVHFVVHKAPQIPRKVVVPGIKHFVRQEQLELRAR